MLRQQGLWMKRASEGANSLMRAVSNSLFFSEVQHEALQKRVLEYYMANQGSSDLVFFELQDEESCLLFLQNPSLPEFEFVNLELLARVLDVRIKLYFIEKGILSCNNVHRPSKRKIRILKLFGNHYASVLSAECEERYAFAQNIALSVIDSAISGSPFKLKNHNGNQLVNYEYENWKLQSGMTQDFMKSLNVDYKRNFYSQWQTGNVNKNDSISGSDVNSLALNSSDSVGSIIVSIMEKRRRNNYLHQKNGSIERKYDLLINSSDQCSVKNYETKAKTSSIQERTANNNYEQFESFHSAHQEMDNGFQTFSDRICGNDTNLKKSVPMIELNNIFGVNSPQSFVLNASLKKTLNANADKVSPVTQIDIQEEDDDHGDFPASFEQINQLIGLDDELFFDEPVEKTSCSVLEQQPKSISSPIGSDDQLNGCYSHGYPLSKFTGFSNLKVNPNLVLHGVVAQESLENRPKRTNLRDKLKNKKIEEFKLDSSITAAPTRNFVTSFPPDNPDTIPFENNATLYYNDQLSKQSPRASNLPLSIQPTKKVNVPAPQSKPKQKYRETQSECFYMGTLKFFDEKNGFGFMTVSDVDCFYDVFVYRNEFKRAKVSIDVIRQVKTGVILTFRFQIALYMGKTSECKKAINIRLVDTALPPDSK
jgi:hypothetical protein